METKTRILEAAAELLAKSGSGDISTRAVCEAAGVGPPTLYRHFTDKEGLLTAVVDFGFERYLASKRAAVPSGDPVRDLRNGWDSHVAFALANPNAYKLMYSPVVKGRSEAATEAHRMLTEIVGRVAAAGRLTVPVPVAAQMIMAANVGVALSALYRPETNADLGFSPLVRDAVLASVTTHAADSDGPAAAPAPAAAVSATATTLSAQLRRSQSETLTPTEKAMLQEWLARLERHDHAQKGPDHP
ncbi:TetR/AcrR family transcriptional regulator [Streptomyces sp. NPDC050560]|uniref:TetR/AcrR family transcriptional regulator n=1 Tax=Streptomyces sp. NPDC050560 TaxID=3365630 RepID=UPI0037A3F764